jgi:hypothetical protein
MSDFTVDDNNPGIILYRIRELAKTVAELVNWRRDVDQERVQLRLDAKSLAEEMAELKRVVDGLRKALIGFALTIAGSAVIFALTILASSGKIP